MCSISGQVFSFFLLRVTHTTYLLVNIVTCMFVLKREEREQERAREKNNNLIYTYKSGKRSTHTKNDRVALLYCTNKETTKSMIHILEFLNKDEQHGSIGDQMNDKETNHHFLLDKLLPSLSPSFVRSLALKCLFFFIWDWNYTVSVSTPRTVDSSPTTLVVFRFRRRRLDRFRSQRRYCLKIKP